MSVNSSKGPLQVEAYEIAKNKGYVKTPEEVREEALGEIDQRLSLDWAEAKATIEIVG